MKTSSVDTSQATQEAVSSVDGWNRRDSSLVVPSHVSKDTSPMISLAASAASSTGTVRRSIVRQLKRDIEDGMKQSGVRSSRQRRKLRRSISGQLQKIAATLGEGSE